MPSEPRGRDLGSIAPHAPPGGEEGMALGCRARGGRQATAAPPHPLVHSAGDYCVLHGPRHRDPCSGRRGANCVRLQISNGPRKSFSFGEQGGLTESSLNSAALYWQESHISLRRTWNAPGPSPSRSGTGGCLRTGPAGHGASHLEARRTMRPPCAPPWLAKSCHLRSSRPGDAPPMHNVGFRHDPLRSLPQGWDFAVKVNLKTGRCSAGAKPNFHECF